MDRHQFCVIMAGGGGSHFWPVTRESRPKQMINVKGTSLLRAAYDRCKGLVPEDNILLVTLEDYKGFAEEIIPELSPENILLEPYPRKTGPCIALATYSILKRDPDAIVAFTPCDLIIHDNDNFRKTLEGAFSYVAAHPVLMTLGIVPQRPSPEYGYIQVQGGKRDFTPGEPIEVKTFMEKPTVELAEVFLKSGEFLWNSGVFVWPASLIRSEMEEYMPQITCQFDGWESALGGPMQKDFIEKAYSGCEKLSIDYGVMEKTSKAWVWPAEFGWSDIDNWRTLYENYPTRDEKGNIIVSNGSSSVMETSGSIIVERNAGKLIAVCGLEDFTVIDTPDVLLICPRGDDCSRKVVASLSPEDTAKYK